MSLLVSIGIAPTAAPTKSEANPYRLIAGDPAFKTWIQDGSVETEVWEATPGEMRSIKGGTYGFSHILSGVVEIGEDGGETRTFQAGDSFVMRPGVTGVWRTLETVLKIYVLVL